MSLRVRTALSLLVALALFGCAPRRESVREELVRQQKETGLSLVAVENNKTYTVQFGTRSIHEARTFINKGTASHGAISPDGTEIAFDLCPEPGFTHPTPERTECPAGAMYLALIRIDGTGFREFKYLAYPHPCWFSDKSMLALGVSNRKENPYATPTLEIFNLRTEATQVADGLDTHVTSQCWSADGKQVVYTANKPRGVQIVRVYDTEQKKSWELAKGANATWSPDGKWIAFRDCVPDLHDCTFYAIGPSGDERKVLFGGPVDQSVLWWSPDSRFVAYVSERSFFERSPLTLTERLWRLRVRRLDDNSEDWVANISGADPLEYQWVMSAEIGKH